MPIRMVRLTYSANNSGNKTYLVKKNVKHLSAYADMSYEWQTVFGIPEDKMKHSDDVYAENC